MDPSVLISFLLNLDPGKTKLYLRKHHLQNITIMSKWLLNKRWKPSIICTFLICFYYYMGYYKMYVFFLGIITLSLQRAKWLLFHAKAVESTKNLSIIFWKFVDILPIYLPPSLNLIVIKFQSSNKKNCVVCVCKFLPQYIATFVYRQNIHFLAWSNRLWYY